MTIRALTTALLLPYAPWRREEVSIESTGTDHQTAVWRSHGHFCFEGITQRCEEMFPWGLSPKEIGAHVFFFFFFFTLFGHTNWHVKS